MTSTPAGPAGSLRTLTGTPLERVVLLPRPRLLRAGPGSAPGAAVPDNIADDSLPAQGFSLDIGDAGIRLRYADEAGLRYGTETLRQLRAQFDDRLPGCHIDDHPDLPVRGHMLDVSRGRVPTMAYLRRMIDLLAMLRINQLQLYTEHTFAYAEHEPVWRHASPLTADEVRQLDAWCAEAGIELVPNQNCFGHMEHWLRHDRYRHLAECPDGYDLRGLHWPGTTLQPTQESADFALSLLDELLPNFTSRTVNIGCDETQEVGRGRSADRVAREGGTAVYVEHLVRLATPLIDRGYRVQFWGDILYKHPEVLDRLPQGVIPVPWTYEAAQDVNDLPQRVRDVLTAIGVDAADFAAGFAPQIPTFAQAPFPYLVAPGTSTWSSLIGRIDNAYGNLDDAADSATGNGADGVLITEWGDGGHLQPPSVNYPPLAYGASQAWCRQANAGLDVPAALDLLVFDDPAGWLGGVLDVIGRQWKRTGRVSFNSSPLSSALLPKTAFDDAAPVDPVATQGVVDALDQAAAELAEARPRVADGGTVRTELAAAIRLARHGAWRLLREADAARPDDAALKTDLGQALDTYLQAWDLRSRPGGREISEGKLRQTLAEY